MYNVERYIGACLRSICSQTYRNLEVIVVDDGSPDGSRAIADEVAKHDYRVRVVSRKNGGLSAARNTGARHAHGEYIIFIDSDDTLRADAIESYVTTLSRSGSDFAVGGYKRINETQSWNAAYWIRELHSVDRVSTTLEKSPDALVNAVAWSKCYKRSFWKLHQFTFPEGVLYEDQALSAKAYSLASKFDIVGQLLHNWRVREDQSSITQDSATARDLFYRFKAARDSLAELEQFGSAELASARQVQLFNNDFPVSIRKVENADDEYWSLLQTGIEELSSQLTEDQWEHVHSHHKVEVYLVTHGLRDELIEFTSSGMGDENRSPTAVIGQRVYCDYPIRKKIGLEISNPIFGMSVRQTRLVTSIRGLRWLDRTTVEVRGWAYVNNVNFSEESIRTQISLVDQAGNVALTATAAYYEEPELDLANRHLWCDYQPGAFRAIFDLSQVRADTILGDRRSSFLELRADVEVVGKLSRSSTFPPVTKWAGAATPAAGEAQDGLQYRFLTSHGRVGVELRQLRLQVQAVVVDGRRVRLTFTAAPELDITHVQFHSNGLGRNVRVPVNFDGEAYSAEANLPDANKRRPRDAANLWSIRAVAKSRRKYALPVSGALVAGIGEQPEAPIIPARSLRGNLGILDEYPRIEISDVSTGRSDSLTISGRSDGLNAGEITFAAVSVRGGRAEATGSVAADGTFSIDFRAENSRWGGDVLPLPAGGYRTECSVRRGATEGAVKLHAHLGTELLQRITFNLMTIDHYVKVERYEEELHLNFGAPVPSRERSRRVQHGLQDGFGLQIIAHERPIVLFRSYFGEIAGCNSLAIHNEIKRRGLDVELRWAVKDRSVIVPRGAQPVLHESRAWYESLKAADLYIDNMHQPIYHEKPSHQVFVETFHGYPFKQMGITQWKTQGRTRYAIERDLERAAQWDYLLSPATYATQPLKREFGFSGPTLEFGYPRNDILQSAKSGDIGRSVRERLGIPETALVVLYAPTFRDSASRDNFSAAPVRPLNVAELAAAIPNVVVLLRGHAFNARTKIRYGTKAGVIDVTDYQDVNDLMLASDAAVLDYSSIRFDYALTGKPMVFMVPDLEQYRDETRGWLFDYDSTAPGPLVRSTAEVIQRIEAIEEVRREYEDARLGFRRTYLDLDDGHAAERFVDYFQPLLG